MSANPTIATGKSDDLFRRPTYRTGDGETIVPPRPGSHDALSRPSRFGDRLHYRDGSVQRVPTEVDLAEQALALSQRGAA